MNERGVRRKIALLSCLLVFSTMSMTGCWNARELKSLQIVAGMGIDMGEEPGNIRLTAQIINTNNMGSNSSSDSGNGGGGNEGAKPYWNLTSEEAHIFLAAREMTHKLDQKLFVAHNQVIVFSEEVAAEGLGEYIDFFLRAHEMRPNSLVLISKPEAFDVLDNMPETGLLPATSLAKLDKSYGNTSHWLKVNLKDFTTALRSKTISPTLPLVDIILENGEKNFEIDGLAVLKKDKMVGTLDKEETRGLLWVTGMVKSGVITVPSPDGKEEVILEITKTSTKTNPELKDGKIIINIDIKEESSLTEQTSQEDMSKAPLAEVLQKEQEDIIRSEIIKSFKKSKELKTDIFGFGEMIHKKYKNEWKELELNWDEIYPSIQLNISIKSKLGGTGLISEPVISEKGGAQ